MKYIKIVNGPIDNNTYLLYNECNECVIVDPSFDYELIEKKIIDSRLKVKGIILTHAHYDHIISVDYFASKYEINVYCGENTSKYIKDPMLNMSGISKNSPNKIILNSSVITVKNEFQIDSFKFKCILTYGHSRTCTTFLTGVYAFTGDFVFKNTIGRVDLFDSSMELMIESIRTFSKLPLNYFILSGHGDETTLEDEKKYNKYFKKYGV